MLLHSVVILAVYVSFSAFVQCFFNVLCCMNLTLRESHVHTAHIGRKTPTPIFSTQSSFSSLCVVLTKKQYFPGHHGCYPSDRNIPLINNLSFSITKGFW